MLRVFSTFGVLGPKVCDKIITLTSGKVMRLLNYLRDIVNKSYAKGRVYSINRVRGVKSVMFQDFSVKNVEV